MNKKTLLVSLCAIVLLAAVYFAYTLFFAPTRIALVHFPTYQVSNFILANDNRNIRVEKVEADKASSLTRYDAILVFGPGFRPTESQVKAIEKAEKKGIPVYSFVFTSNSIKGDNLSEEQRETLDTYYENRSRANFGNMLGYLRAEFDGRKLFRGEVTKPVIVPSDIFYYLEEGTFFRTAEELTSHLQQKGLYKEGAPRIALLSGSMSPLEGNRAYVDSLITGFTREGFNVYPFSSSARRLELLKEIAPQAVIYMPMGRLADDAAVQWLTKNDIPLFCPLPVSKSREAWLEDPHGATGGYLTARIVLPEIDGGIYPLVVSTEDEARENLFVIQPEPERTANFIANVTNYLSLRTKSNADKRLGIYYFRGAGQNSLVATGLEVAPSLYNFLQRLKSEGYNVDGLPDTFDGFNELLQRQGAVWGSYAEGALADFLQNGNPQWISKTDYEQWVNEVVAPHQYKQVTDTYGEAPGSYMSGLHNGEPSVAIARLQFGNVVILPQPRAAIGGDDFKMVHGADVPPPHAYIASYLWLQKGFRADALIHFGTHGSLEFTPGKQAALSREDWADCLIGTLPHFYYYSISNVGEGIITKRRLHSVLSSYLTPPFMESRTRNSFDELFDKLEAWRKASDEVRPHAASEVKSAAVALGIHRDLQLDDDLSEPYTEEEMAYIENFIEEIANEKMTGRLYTLGEPYDTQDIFSSVLAISADPLAYSMARLDLLNKRITREQYESNAFISGNYLTPVKKAIREQLASGNSNPQRLLYGVARLTPADLERAHAIDRRLNPPPGMMEMMGMGGSMPSTEEEEDNKEDGKPKMPAGMPRVGKMPESVKKMLAEREKAAADKSTRATEMKGMGGSMPADSETVTDEEREFAAAILEIERTASNVGMYKRLLEESPEQEMQSLLRGLNGGYIAPSPGGDAVRNPNTLPTGRNMFSINAENTPTITAWNAGKALADATIEQYRSKHGSYPRKVSYTFWAGEFIESEGTTLAQALYMLGVEPIRDGMNRVTDLRLIPSEELGRPRIDIVVQTSGQLRDLAASRLLMITRAVKMAATAGDDQYENYVAGGTVQSEKALVDKGISPLEARDLSVMRVFGGLNGHYGTGIMSLVEKGDAWEDATEVAQTYINNMSAIYGSEKEWGAFSQHLFEVALQNTDIVVQPRQNNTWGALSLDHVYEFMGGINLSVETVTGKSPDTYLADYRNRNRSRMQELKEAIGVESRTTLLNPEYIKEKMKGGASSANTFAKTIRNTYGWNVMKSDAIDDELWDELHNVYVRDKFNLDVQSYFERENPAALQEISAVMLETARKGMWDASEEQLNELAILHTGLVRKFGESGSDFSGDNTRLQAFIAERVSPEVAQEYREGIRQIQQASAEVKDGMVLKKDALSQPQETGKNALDGLIVAVVVLVGFVTILVLIRKRRKNQ